VVPAGQAGPAGIRPRRDRRELVKVLAGRRRPVQAYRRRVRSDVLAWDHGKAPYRYGNVRHRRMVTFSQPRRHDIGNKQPEPGPSPEPITPEATAWTFPAPGEVCVPADPTAADHGALTAAEGDRSCTERRMPPGHRRETQPVAHWELDELATQDVTDEKTPVPCRMAARTPKG
jgi:hypothetical protein